MATASPPPQQPNVQQADALAAGARPAWMDGLPDNDTHNVDGVADDIGSALSAASHSAATLGKTGIASGAAPNGKSPRSRLWLWAVLGLFAGVLAIVLYRPPAAWLAWAIDSATQGHARIINPQGTVWNGSGSLLLTGGRDSRDAMLLPEQMHWQLTPGWGNANLTLNLDCCAATPAHVTLSPSGSGVQMRLDALDWTLPADLLEGLGAPLNTLALRGRIRLHAKEVQWQQSDTGGNMQGNISMDLLDMSASMSTLDSLGSYRVELRGQSSGMPTMELQTTQGPLQLEGSGQWRDGRFRFSGAAWPDAGYESSLNNLLNIMGNKSGNRYLLAL